MICSKCDYENAKVLEGEHPCPICNEPMLVVPIPKQDLMNLRTLLANGGSECTPNELIKLFHAIDSI